MIPIRVPAGMRPVLANERRFRINPGHPLYRTECPACGTLFVQSNVMVLVLVGVNPENRTGKKVVTAGAVAVHAACAGVSGESSD